MTISDDEIEAKRTSNGGFTREQLAEWGVAWPPPKGWKRSLASGLPHPFKCSKCDYIGSSKADVNNHWFDEH